MIPPAVESQPSRPVPVLYVESVEGMLRYRLDVPGRALDEPLQEEFVHRLDRGSVQALQASADALLRRAEARGFVEEARTRGSVLYRTLLPPRLREPLRALTGPLLVSTSLYGLPWELLHDDEEFWGLRYAIGKRLVMDRPLAAASSPVRARPRALVVGSDPRGDLPFVRHEVEEVCDTLAELADVTCVSGRMATFDAVSGHLNEAYDLVHYCGHVVVDPQAGPGLLLAHERQLPAAVIELGLTGRPLVFLNGCASARGLAGAPTPEWERVVSSVAYGFLFGGALAVIGTLCDVSDRHAARLAHAFYRELTVPASIGEALRRARLACRGDPASVDSPTWLSFALHGNPALLFTADRVAPRRTVPTEALAPRTADTGPADRGVVRRTEAAFARRLRIATSLVVLMVAAAIVYHVRRTTHPPGPLVIGVMEVQAKGTPVPDWMRRFTRDGFNTLLSDVRAVRVYSRQKIDFVSEKRRLSEIEVAESLGMSKMVSASLSISGSTVALEVEVVDIKSGLLDASVHLQGKREELIAIQNEAVLRVLQALPVTVTPAERESILRERTNDELESYRLLMESLGSTKGEEGGTPAPSKESPHTSWFPRGGIAYAQEQSPDEAAIHTLLARYQAALEAESVERLSEIQVEMPAAQRGGLLRYFENARNLVVRFLDLDLVVEGDEALATFTREDTFNDARSGRWTHLKVRISTRLEKRAGEWKVRGPKEGS